MMNYRDWNEQCKDDYRKLFPNVNYTIWDGVISPEDYTKSPLKIMFLNREPYDEDWEEYDLAEVLNKELALGEKPIFKDQKNLRKRLKEYLGVVELLENGCLMTISDDELIDKINALKVSDLIFERMMPSVAYVNVKKSDGIKKSYIPDLRRYAIQGQSILAKQIEFFNPSIILAGNVGDGVLYSDEIEKLGWGANLYSPEGKSKVRIFQMQINGKLYPFVDMYHPSATQGWMSTYYLDLFHALKEVEKNFPNYWNKRLNLQCFNIN